MRGICIVKKLRIRKFQNKLVTERKVIYIIKLKFFFIGVRDYIKKCN